MAKKDKAQNDKPEEDEEENTLWTDLKKAISGRKEVSALIVAFTSLIATSFISHFGPIRSLEALFGLIIALSVAYITFDTYKANPDKRKEIIDQIKKHFPLLVALTAGLVVIFYLAGKDAKQLWTGSLLTEALVYSIGIGLGGILAYETGKYLRNEWICFKTKNKTKIRMFRPWIFGGIFSAAFSLVIMIFLYDSAVVATDYLSNLTDYLYNKKAETHAFVNKTLSRGNINFESKGPRVFLALGLLSPF